MSEMHPDRRREILDRVRAAGTVRVAGPARELQVSHIRAGGADRPNMMEAEVDRLFLGRCDRSVVLADSTESGLAGLHRIAGLDEVDVVVMDGGVDVRPALRRSVPDLRLEAVR